LFGLIGPLYAASPELRAVKGRWIEARLVGALGSLDRAEDVLAEIRIAYLEHRMGYDAALADLDLARVCRLKGDRKKARGVAAEVLPEFVARGIRREAREALRLLAETA
jgi:hypothetical protein